MPYDTGCMYALHTVDYMRKRIAVYITWTVSYTYLRVLICSEL